MILAPSAMLELKSLIFNAHSVMPKKDLVDNIAKISKITAPSNHFTYPIIVTDSYYATETDVDVDYAFCPPKLELFKISDDTWGNEADLKIDTMTKIEMNKASPSVLNADVLSSEAVIDKFKMLEKMFKYSAIPIGSMMESWEENTYKTFLDLLPNDSKYFLDFPYGLFKIEMTLRISLAVTKELLDGTTQLTQRQLAEHLFSKMISEIENKVEELKNELLEKFYSE